MADIQALQYKWRNFSVDRGKARREVQAEVDLWQEQINQLREQITAKEQEFDDYWKNRKVQIRTELDEAVKDELRAGKSAQAILRELGSQNTVWIYGLAAEVKEEGPEAIRTTPGIESVPDQVLEGVQWLHHDHTGVHRWLLSTDRRYIKRYGADETDYADQWFVANRDNYSFVAGNKALYDATSKSEMGKRIAMLEKLLEGNYPGKLKLAENRWVA